MTSAASEFQRLPTSIDERNTRENRDLLKQTHATLAHWISDVRRVVADFQNAFADPVAEKALGQYFAGITEWRERREAHRREYEEAKARAATHEQTLSQIQTLEARLAEINEAADAKSQQLVRLGDPASDFDALRMEWKFTHRKRADLLEQQCRKLTAVSKLRLRATLRRATDIVPLAERLKQLIKGTKTRGDRVDKLLEQVSTSSDPLETWHAILD